MPRLQRYAQPWIRPEFLPDINPGANLSINVHLAALSINVHLDLEKKVLTAPVFPCWDVCLG
jgi:hypothetical protein